MNPKRFPLSIQDFSPGILAVLLLTALLVYSQGADQISASPQAILLSADFNSDESGFTYQDDPFNTSQPSYASGSHTASGGYSSSGGLQVNLGGVDSTSISGMSGGWGYSLNLAAPTAGLSLSFRYRLEQSATYEFDEYSQVLVKFGEALFGRGTKNYIDQIGGDGSSSQGNSSSYLPTSEWQQVEIYLGDYDAGEFDLVIGAYNNQKNAADETTSLVIDDVVISDGNSNPPPNDAQRVVDRLDMDSFKGYLQGIAQFDDRCRGPSMGCSSTDYETNYYNSLGWVETELQAMGYSTERHDFNYNGNTGTNLWATKIGSTTPTEMYMISAHLDGRGGGDAYDDDGSGVALVLEAARVFAAPDVSTTKSIRFIFWDKEELGLYGSNGYVQDRRTLQGTPGEPTWLGLITHDMILYDHGAGTAGSSQSAYADLDVEWRAGTAAEGDSKDLAIKWRFNSGDYASNYPANAYNYSTNTDDTPFHPYVASISVRENRRALTSGGNAEWINPYYHKTSDIESSYSTADIQLGFNAVQITVGTIAELAGAQVEEVEKEILLIPGWNLVTLPLNPLQVYSAQSLLDEINSIPGGSCSQVRRWLGEDWESYSDGQGSGDFPITPASGYFLRCSQAATWTMHGTDFGYELELSLVPGWNLIGVPYPEDDSSAQQILDDINNEGDNCTEINRWAMAGWSAHLDGLPFNNFSLRSDQGYFVLCEMP